MSDIFRPGGLDLSRPGLDWDSRSQHFQNPVSTVKINLDTFKSQSRHVEKSRSGLVSTVETPRVRYFKMFLVLPWQRQRLILRRTKRRQNILKIIFQNKAINNFSIHHWTINWKTSYSNFKPQLNDLLRTWRRFYYCLFAAENWMVLSNN